MMNGRIEELAKGCFEYIEGTLDGDIVEFDYKKFAELLVRESRPWLADDAFEEVKKHFGLDK